MSDGAAERPAPDSPGSGVRPRYRFLEINLESLRIPEDSREEVQEVEPNGHVETLADGTSVVRTPTALLGTPLPPATVLAQLGTPSVHNVVVVFGLGTGQVPRAVRAMCNVPIVVYEPDPGVLRTVLEYGPLDLGPIPIASNLADLTKIWRDFAARLVDVRVLTTPGYYRAYPAQVREFVDMIPTLLQRTAISKATYQNRAKVWVQDIIDNVELLTHSPPFLTLGGRFAGVPAFIVGAGPSLDKNIHLLREAARKGILFATNSGAIALGKHGIEPQVICCIESIDSSSKLGALPFIDRAVRAFSLSAAPESLRTGKGPLMPVHEHIAQFTGALEDLTGHGGLPMSGSVSTIATSLARVLGCSPLVLVGHDLAYSGGRTYANGTGYESSRAEIDEKTGVINLKWNDELVRLHGTAQGQRHDQEELRRVPAWGGQGEVDSGAAFTGVRHWFATTAEMLQKMESPIQFVNASEGGVHIDNWQDLPLAEVLAGLEYRDITAEAIERDARAEWTPIPLERIITWLEAHAEAARNVLRVARRLRRYATLSARVTAQGNPRNVTRIYECMERAEAALRDSVAGCPLVDAWAHRAVDIAMIDRSAPALDQYDVGPHRAAVDANEKSARVARAVEVSARELDDALTKAAVRLRARRDL
jgi:6-hydroxymethylpterin diphosphokinase MptE-like protein